jgi:hypothetical protein
MDFFQEGSGGFAVSCRIDPSMGFRGIPIYSPDSRLDVLILPWWQNRKVFDLIERLGDLQFDTAPRDRRRRWDSQQDWNGKGDASQAEDQQIDL